MRCRFFFGDTGLFCGNMGLFCGNIGLFWGNLGLFWGNLGLFVTYLNITGDASEVYDFVSELNAMSHSFVGIWGSFVEM